MTTSSDRDWLFYYDFTWERWWEDNKPTSQEMHEYLRDPTMKQAIMNIIRRDLGEPVTIDSHLDMGAAAMLRGRAVEADVAYSYTVKINGETIVDDFEAAAVLTTILMTGKVPEETVNKYRASIGLRPLGDYRPVVTRP